MTHEVIFAPEAQAELLKLYDDLAREAGPEVAYRYTDRLHAYCLSFATFPERGTRRDDLRPGLRVTGFRRRVTIAFHVTARTVVIDRLLYGGRDLEALLGDDGDE